MSGEVRTRWETLIAPLEKDGSLKRYANYAKEPKALFDRIGEDLDSSNEAIRNKAYWILVCLTPELINVIHERETRNPGWQDIEGKDQKLVNDGIGGSKCILKHLHTKIVKEHDFKVRNGNKKDPRPYLDKAIENWKKDGKRKRKNRDGIPREVPLDYKAALEIPDPAGFPEIAIETYDDLWKEYKIFFRDRDAFDVFIAHHVDERPLEEIRERWGIPSEEAVRQRKSRINKEMVARRDTLFTLLLFTSVDIDTWGPNFRSRLYNNAAISEQWLNRVKLSVQPRGWLNGKMPDGKNPIAIQTLTTGLHDAPAYIYLAATKESHFKEAQEVIDLTIEPRRCSYFITLDKQDSAEFHGLIAALEEVPRDYYPWLISCLPSPYERMVRIETLKALFGVRTDKLDSHLKLNTNEES